MNKRKEELSREKNRINVSKKIVITFIIILCIILGVFVFYKYIMGKTEAKKENINVNDELVTSEINLYNSAMDLYRDSNYEEAYKSFGEISSDAIEYDDAQDYMEICKNNLVSQCIKKANKLLSEGYYTKALDKLYDYNEIIGNDEKIKNKISEIEKDRLEHINSELNIESDTIITSENINTLNISSPTKYMVFVSLNEQKVYIYKGYANNWILEKTFVCSSGIKGEETPPGNFYIENRGYSFYSEDYEQGAKYWVGFMGNYLFHSLPYNEDLTEIVDPTLGTPASHGCIRLDEEDAKWIYNYIPQSSRVIIR